MLSFSCFAQNNPSPSYPQNYFRPPLDLAPQASGSFGELRANHFHSGTDYRTNQREGYPVFAVADGFVSRVRVQIGGGGNTVYLDHPNGYTSVYMHLLKYNDKIAKVVQDKQYADQVLPLTFHQIKILLRLRKVKSSLTQEILVARAAHIYILNCAIQKRKKP